MNKLTLPKEVAKEFVELYEDGDYLAFDYLKKQNNEKEILDWDRECLLYTILSMNNILNDYWWENTPECFDKDLRPDFDEKWLIDLENKYLNTKQTFLKSFSNISCENSLEIEYVEIV